MEYLTGDEYQGTGTQKMEWLYKSKQHKNNGQDDQVHEDEPTAPPPRQGRGPGKTRQAELDVSKRPELWPVGPGEFDSNPECKMIVNTIVKLALTNMPGPFRTYNLWPQDWKNVVHNEFLEIYKWRVGENLGHCREVMEQICSKNYYEHLRRVRNDCMQKYGADTDNWKLDVPYWCKSPTHWHGLCDIWAIEGWQKLSTQNRHNCCGAGRIVTHYSGSRSAYKHHKTLSKELKREATCTELFLHIHVKRDKGKKKAKGKGKQVVHEDTTNGQDVQGTGNEGDGSQDNSSGTITDMRFVDSKSQEIYERYNELQADPTNAEKTPELLWLLASGGPSHGRKYGLGSKLTNTAVPANNTRARAQTYSTSSETSGVTGPQQQLFTIEEVNKMMEDRDKRYAEERVEREQRDLERINQTNYHLSQLYAFVGMQMPMPPGQQSNPQMWEPRSPPSQPMQHYRQ